MIKRKTIELNKVLDHFNYYLRNSDEASVEFRQSIKFLLEELLVANNLFSGLQFLSQDETHGKPGINHLGGIPHPDEIERFLDTDPTRVRYL